MKAFLPTLVAGFLMIVSSAGAQVITVTITGAVTEVGPSLNPPNSSSIPLDSSVEFGTPYTFIQTIDATAPAGVFGGFNSYFSSTAFGSSLSLGDYNFTTSSGEVYLSQHGFDFFPSEYLGTEDGYQYPLFSIYLAANSGAIQDFSLNGLNVPLSDFNDGSYLQLSYGFPFSNPVDLAFGNVTSYTVTETPEPSTWSLLLGGLGLLAVIPRRLRRV